MLVGCVRDSTQALRADVLGAAAEVARAIGQAIAAGKRKSVPDLFARQAIKFRRHFSRLAPLVFLRVFRRFYVVEVY